MAQHKIQPNTMCLFLSRDNVTFSTTICLTSIQVTRTTTEIDAKSFCGPDKLPGTQENGVTFEGQIMEDPAGGSRSSDELIDFWETKQTIYFKVGPAIPLIGDETDYGSGFISKLDKAFALDAVGTFSGQIGIYGLISRTTATS